MWQFLTYTIVNNRKNTHFGKQKKSEHEGLALNISIMGTIVRRKM